MTIDMQALDALIDTIDTLEVESIALGETEADS